MAASTVIKAGEVGTVLKRLSRVDLADHLREADAVVAAARRRAEEIIQEARDTAHRVHETSRKEGHSLGLEEGRRAGQAAGHAEAFRAATDRFHAEQAQLLRALGALLGELEARKRELLCEAQRDLVKFAVDVASKLTFSIGLNHPESAVANLERALSKVVAATDVVVRAHPADLAALQTFASSHLSAWSNASHVRIESADSVAPGGCVVMTGASQIDATLPTMVDQVCRAILGEGGDG